MSQQAFREAYVKSLTKAVRQHPDQYYLGNLSVEDVVDRMIVAIMNNRFNIGPALRAAAINCKIKPTQAAIRTYIMEVHHD